MILQNISRQLANHCSKSKLKKDIYKEYFLASYQPFLTMLIN
jgi:hypothetical protein